MLALKGPPGFPIVVEVSSRIDSVRGQLWPIAGATPDVPHRANVRLTAHNSKLQTLEPVMRVSCAKKRGERRSRR